MASSWTTINPISERSARFHSHGVKDFELVVIPGAHHTMGESFGEHKRYDFFVRNLLNVNPPKWSELK